MRSVIPLIMPSDTVSTMIRGTRLIPMHTNAPKRLRRAFDFLPVRGNKNLEAIKSDEENVMPIPYMLTASRRAFFIE